jgi:hypothetical protein
MENFHRSNCEVRVIDGLNKERGSQFYGSQLLIKKKITW